MKLDTYKSLHLQNHLPNKHQLVSTGITTSAHDACPKVRSPRGLLY